MPNYVIVKMPALPAVGSVTSGAAVAVVSAADEVSAVKAAAALVGVDPMNSGGALVWSSLASAHTRYRATGVSTFNAAIE